MTALEKIEKLKKLRPVLVGIDGAHDGVVFIAPKDFKFFLRAFNALWNVALKKTSWGENELKEDFENEMMKGDK